MQLAKDEATARACEECMAAMLRGAERVEVAIAQLPDSYMVYRQSWVHLLWNLSSAFGLPEVAVHHALALLDVAMASGLSCGGEPMMRLVAACCLLLAATALNQAPNASGRLHSLCDTCDTCDTCGIEALISTSPRFHHISTTTHHNDNTSHTDNTGVQILFPSGAVVEEVLRVPLATVESMQHEVLSLLGNDLGVVTWLQYVQVCCERLGVRDLVGAGLSEQQATMAVAGTSKDTC